MLHNYLHFCILYLNRVSHFMRSCSGTKMSQSGIFIFGPGRRVPKRYSGCCCSSSCS